MKHLDDIAAVVTTAAREVLALAADEALDDGTRRAVQHASAMLRRAAFVVERASHAIDVDRGHA